LQRLQWQQAEKARAEGRATVTPIEKRPIAGSVQIAAQLPDDILFQHTVFCQTVLPYRDPGPEVRIWERQQGNVSLSLEAGRTKGPQGQFVPVGLQNQKTVFKNKRCKAIGTGDTELYVFAGMRAAVVISVRVFLFRGAGRAN
jgi:hypothetical protein